MRISAVNSVVFIKIIDANGFSLFSVSFLFETISHKHVLKSVLQAVHCLQGRFSVLSPALSAMHLSCHGCSRCFECLALAFAADQRNINNMADGDTVPCKV